MFTIGVSAQHEVSGIKQYGKLNLIDLAGSERIAVSGATGPQLKEAQAINKSLSALGGVIEGLGGKKSHVPYRDSKLTHLLAPCLGGSSKVLMFANVSPVQASWSETLCTLRFASKVFDACGCFASFLLTWSDIAFFAALFPTGQFVRTWNRKTQCTSVGMM